MARKSPDGGASTATADKPERKTRTRKSPKEKAESLTVKALNALDALGCMSAKLTEPQRDGVLAAVKAKLNELDLAFQESEEESDEPEPFSLPD